MPPRNWRHQKARKADSTGLGRNCALFDTARRWFYREVRHHWGDPDSLTTANHAEVHALNEDFSEPLPQSEARAIAASISRWILSLSRIWADGPAVYEATFTTVQTARSRKAGQQRSDDARDRMKGVLDEHRS